MTKAQEIFEKIAIEIDLKHILLGTGLGAAAVGTSMLLNKHYNSKLNPVEADEISKKLKKYLTPGFGDEGFNRDIDTFTYRLKNRPSEKNIKEAKDYINFMDEQNHNNR